MSVLTLTEGEEDTGKIDWEENRKQRGKVRVIEKRREKREGTEVVESLEWVRDGEESRDKYGRSRD